MIRRHHPMLPEVNVAPVVWTVLGLLIALIMGLVLMESNIP